MKFHSSEVARSDVNDISEEGRRKVAEEIETLRSICDRLNQVIEHAPDGIYVTDGNAFAMRINPAFERISGLMRKDMLGVNHRVLEEEGIVAKSSSLLAIERRKTVTIIHEYLSTGKQALVTSTPLFNAKGEIELVVSGTRDLTELNDVRSKLAAEQKQRLRYEEQLAALHGQLRGTPNLVAVDKKTIDMFALASRVARVDSTVLIRGETGTGKEEIAKYLHNHSHRSEGPFIAINCGAIPESLIESELFGYERGSFTGALKEGKMGLLEAASGGTVFLDEIGELPLDMQVKLLRALESRTVTRVGGRKSIPLDIRVISATNRDLKRMIQENAFREDLFYRLCVVQIGVPALRERKDDIVPLARQFLDQVNRHYGYQKELSPMAYRLMLQYSWPGNVRELKNVVENVVVMSDTDVITADALPFHEDSSERISANQGDSEPLKVRLEKLEYLYMQEAYAANKNGQDAAAALGMTRATFLRKYQIYKNKYPAENQNK